VAIEAPCAATDRRLRGRDKSILGGKSYAFHANTSSIRMEKRMSKANTGGHSGTPGSQGKGVVVPGSEKDCKGVNGHSGRGDRGA